MTFAEFRRAVRALAFPAGESPYTVEAHNQSIADALSDLQTWVPCLRQVNVELVPHCATLYKCGTTAFQAPLGKVLEVGVVSERAKTLPERSTPFATGLFLGRREFRPPSNEPRMKMFLSLIHTTTWEYRVGVRVKLSGLVDGAYPFTPGRITIKGRTWWKDSDSTKNVYIQPATGWLMNRTDWTLTTSVGQHATLDLDLQVSPRSAIYSEVREVMTSDDALPQMSYALQFDMYGPPYSRNPSLLTADTEWCGYIKYRYVRPEVFETWYKEVAEAVNAKDPRTAGRGLQPGLCQVMCRRFLLPGWVSQRLNELPNPLAATRQYPLGYIRATSDTDNPSGRALAGVWTIINGMIHIAPWVQSYEHVVVHWSGIKKTWQDTDLVPNDPLVLRAVAAAAARDHAKFYDKNYAYAAIQEADYQDARTSLYVNCIQKSRPTPLEQRGDAMATVQSIFGLPQVTAVPVVPTQPPVQPPGDGGDGGGGGGGGGTDDGGGPGGGGGEQEEWFGNDAFTRTYSCTDLNQYGNESVTIAVEANRFRAQTKALANQLAEDYARLMAAQQLRGRCRTEEGFRNTVRAECVAECLSGPNAELVSGQQVRGVVEPGEVISPVSEDDANQIAQQIACNRATEQLVCIYGNRRVCREQECPTDPDIKVNACVDRAEFQQELRGASARDTSVVSGLMQQLNRQAEAELNNRLERALTEAQCPETAVVCRTWGAAAVSSQQREYLCYTFGLGGTQVCAALPCTAVGYGYGVVEVCLEIGQGSEYQFHDRTSALNALNARAATYEAMARNLAEGAAVNASAEAAGQCPQPTRVRSCGMCGSGTTVTRTGQNTLKLRGKHLDRLQQVP